MNTAIVTAWLLGLFGSVHCIGMCGGLASALAFALPTGASTARRMSLLTLMGAGRITSYALLGALGGALLPAASGTVSFLPRFIAGLLLVLMGLSIAGWRAALAPLERAGHRAWQRIGPRAMKIARVERAGGALMAGVAWGWLPCGLVYSTLAWASSSGEAARSAALMAAFGMGTLPAVMASGALAAGLRSVLQTRGLRVAAGLLVAGFGIWTLALPLVHGSHGAASHAAMPAHHASGHPHHDGHGSPDNTDQKR